MIPQPFTINGVTFYHRSWLLNNFPGMNVKRLIRLEKEFGLLPTNSGNRHAEYLYRGDWLLEALERESIANHGQTDDQPETDSPAEPLKMIG